MRCELVVLALVSCAAVCFAQEAPSPALTPAQRAARPRQVPVGQANYQPASEGPANLGPVGSGQATSQPGQPEHGQQGPAQPTSGATNDTAAPDAPKFVSEAKWALAGYNNDELVYTVFVTNQDARIIRCTTEVKGFYFDNGTKLSISDRQITTVFPNQPTRVGYWMDMDQPSGATYSVKCHPV